LTKKISKNDWQKMALPFLRMKNQADFFLKGEINGGEKKCF